MKKIILIGAGGHANSCVDIILVSKQFKITYLLEREKSKTVNIMEID